jgi:hypothetical protein
MAMRRNPAKLHVHFSARARVVLLSAAVFMLSFLLASCRSSQTGRTLTEEQELPQRIAALSRQEQVLTAELALARSQAPYLSIDFTTRKMDLKIQGHSLRSFTINKIKRTGGSPVVAQTWIKQEAKPLQVTTRSRVVPGSGEATTASVATHDPWGPQRMPSDYDLICRGAQALEIRSLASEQSHNRFTRWIVNSYRQVQDWARDVWRRNKSDYKESIEIWIGEDDAKLLFWSLPRQFSILVLNAS